MSRLDNIPILESRILYIEVPALGPALARAHVTTAVES
jgi:hypothetical protein